jgi:hypothetical protein
VDQRDTSLASPGLSSIQ